MPDEVRGRLGDGYADGSAGGKLGRDLDPDQVGQCGVDGGEVAVHDGVAPFAIGLGYRRLDLGNRHVGRQYTREGEEARLHHRVDPVS